MFNKLKKFRALQDLDKTLRDKYPKLVHLLTTVIGVDHIYVVKIKVKAS